MNQECNAYGTQFASIAVRGPMRNSTKQTKPKKNGIKKQIDIKSLLFYRRFLYFLIGKNILCYKRQPIRTNTLLFLTNQKQDQTIYRDVTLSVFPRLARVVWCSWLRKAGKNFSSWTFCFILNWSTLSILQRKNFNVLCCVRVNMRSLFFTIAT